MFSELERFCWFHTWFYLGLTINWITSSCSFCQHKVQDMLQKRKSSSIGAMNHYTQIRHDELLFCSYMLIATWKFQDNSVCVRNKRDKTTQTRLPVLKEFSHPSWSPSLCFIPSYNHHPNALVFPAAAAALPFFFFHEHPKALCDSHRKAMRILSSSPWSFRHRLSFTLILV